jgi:polyribonucleotide nucleotidyltransferase
MPSKKIKLKNKELEIMISGKEPSFPKYSTQILNLANQNAQGTRPKIVGQMSDLIQEFQGKKLKEWEIWYRNKNPDSIELATDKVYEMIKNLKDSINKIDRDMAREWVTDLVIVKTFAGLKFQEAILKKISEILNTTYRLAIPEEESRGIDGYIGDRPVSIKPFSYKVKMSLPEKIEYDIIYYEKKKDGIVIEFDL